MNILIYLIKTIFISGSLLAYYWLFLRNRPFHRFNRLFLLGLPFFSLIIPLFHFGLPAFLNQNKVSSSFPLLGVGRGTLEEAVTIYGGRSPGPGVNPELLAGIICCDGQCISPDPTL